MTDAIRAEIEVGAPGDCPVARASATAGTPIEDVARSSGRTGDGRVTEEFTLETDDGSEAEGGGDLSNDLPDGERVFDLDSRAVYRFSRDPGDPCVCDSVERFGWPVSDVRARDGSLIVSCYAPDVGSLSTVVAELRDRFDEIRVRRLLRSGEPADLLVVDRGSLTDRQREVVETAHGMGYFDYPKGANASEVAAELGISRSTFSEHLAAAQGKLLDAILDG